MQVCSQEGDHKQVSMPEFKGLQKGGSQADRSLQDIHSSVSIPIAMQLSLGSVPNKRDKVYQHKEHFSSLTIDHLHLCLKSTSKTRDDEKAGCLLARGVALCARPDYVSRPEMPLFRDWEMVAESNPQPGRNYGIINLCEPDKFKGTHPNVVHPQQLHTASSVGGTEASTTGRVSLECRKSSTCISPLSSDRSYNPSKVTSTTVLDAKEMEEHTDSAAQLGEGTVTVSEVDAKFEAIIRKAEEAQQPTMESSTKLTEVLTMLESSTKSKVSTGKEDKNHTTAEAGDVRSGSPVQLVNRSPNHHLHQQVVEEVSEALFSTQHSCFNMHGGGEDQRHHPPQHHQGQGGHSVVGASANKSCEDFYNGRPPVLTSTTAHSVGSTDTSKAGESNMKAGKSSGRICPGGMNNVNLPVGITVHHKSSVSQRSRSTAQLADNVQSTHADQITCGPGKEAYCVLPTQEADCVLLNPKEADGVLPIQEADCDLPTQVADCVLPTRKEADGVLPTQEEDCDLLSPKEAAGVLPTTKEADCVLPTTKEADCVLPTKEADCILPTQEADCILPTQEADCVLLTIQQPVAQHDSFINSGDDQGQLLPHQPGAIELQETEVVSICASYFLIRRNRQTVPHHGEDLSQRVHQQPMAHSLIMHSEAIYQTKHTIEIIHQYICQDQIPQRETMLESTMLGVAVLVVLIVLISGETDSLVLISSPPRYHHHQQVLDKDLLKVAHLEVFSKHEYDQDQLVPYQPKVHRLCEAVHSSVSLCNEVTSIRPVPHLSILAGNWQTEANIELYRCLDRRFEVEGTDIYGMVISAFFTKLISRNTTMPRVYDCAARDSVETAKPELPASRSTGMITLDEFSMEHILARTTTHDLANEQLKSCLITTLARGSTKNSKQYWIILGLVTRNYSEQKLFSQSVQQPVGGTCNRKQSTLVTQKENLPEDEICQVNKLGDKAEKPPVFGHLLNLNEVASKHAEQEGVPLLPGDGESQEPQMTSIDEQFLVPAEQVGLPNVGGIEDGDGGDLEGKPDREIVANETKGKCKFLTVPVVVLAHMKTYLDPGKKEELLMTYEQLTKAQDPQLLLDATGSSAHSLIDHQLQREPDVHVHQVNAAPRGDRDNHQPEQQDVASQAPEGAQFRHCRTIVCQHQLQEDLGVHERGLGVQYRHPHRQAGFPVLLDTHQEELGTDDKAQARDMDRDDEHHTSTSHILQASRSLSEKELCHNYLRSSLSLTLRRVATEKAFTTFSMYMTTSVSMKAIFPTNLLFKTQRKVLACWELIEGSKFQKHSVKIVREGQRHSQQTPQHAKTPSRGHGHLLIDGGRQVNTRQEDQHGKLHHEILATVTPLSSYTPPHYARAGPVQAQIKLSGQIPPTEDFLLVGEVPLPGLETCMEFNNPSYGHREKLSITGTSVLTGLGSIDEEELRDKPELEINEIEIQVMRENLLVPALALVFCRRGPSVWCEGAPSAAWSLPSKDQASLWIARPAARDIQRQMYQEEGLQTDVTQQEVSVRADQVHATGGYLRGAGVLCPQCQGASQEQHSRATVTKFYVYGLVKTSSTNNDGLAMGDIIFIISGPTCSALYKGLLSMLNLSPMGSGGETLDPLQNKQEISSEHNPGLSLPVAVVPTFMCNRRQYKYSFLTMYIEIKDGLATTAVLATLCHTHSRKLEMVEPGEDKMYVVTSTAEQADDGLVSSETKEPGITKKINLHVEVNSLITVPTLSAITARRTWSPAGLGRRSQTSPESLTGYVLPALSPGHQDEAVQAQPLGVTQDKGIDIKDGSDTFPCIPPSTPQKLDHKFETADDESCLGSRGRLTSTRNRSTEPEPDTKPDQDLELGDADKYGEVNYHLLTVATLPDCAGRIERTKELQTNGWDTWSKDALYEQAGIQLLRGHPDMEVQCVGLDDHVYGSLHLGDSSHSDGTDKDKFISAPQASASATHYVKRMMSDCASRGWRSEIKGQDGPEECGEVDLDHSDKEGQDDQFGRASLDEVQQVHDGYCVDDWHVQRHDLHQGREESLVGHVHVLVEQAQEVQQVVGGVQDGALLRHGHHHHVGGVQSYRPKCAQHLLHTIGGHTLHIQGGGAGDVHPGEKAQDPLIHEHQIEEQDTAQFKVYRELGVLHSGPEHRIHFPGLVGHAQLLSQHLSAHVPCDQIVCGESASLVHMQRLHCLHGGSLRQELSQGQHSRRGGGEQIVTIQDYTVPPTFCGDSGKYILHLK